MYIPYIAFDGWIHEANDSIVFPHAQDVIALALEFLLREAVSSLRLVNEFPSIEADEATGRQKSICEES